MPLGEQKLERFTRAPTQQYEKERKELLREETLINQMRKEEILGSVDLPASCSESFRVAVFMLGWAAQLCLCWVLLL